MSPINLPRQFTRVSIDSIYSSATVEAPQSDLSLPEFYFLLLKPVLLAHGYGESTINEFFTPVYK